MLTCILSGLLIIPLAEALPEAQKVQVTCERRPRPFCGEYKPREDIWGEGTAFKMVKGNKTFQMVKSDNNNEYCIYLRQSTQLCGSPDSEVLIKVKNGKRSVQTGYRMVFDLEICDEDDLYSECVSDLNTEVSGGVDATQNSLPFLVRLRIQGARGLQGTCGASLIHEKFFISALHCFNSENFDFLKHCIRRGQPNSRCFAVIREHFINVVDPGEVRINIARIYEGPESSDLVIGELERRVALDRRAQVVAVSREALRPGDIVTTAGWGLTGPTGHLSNVLRRTELEVSVGGAGRIINTKVGYTLKGVPIDTCEGDSGGPLIRGAENLLWTN